VLLLIVRIHILQLFVEKKVKIFILAAGIARPYMIFVTEEVFMGQLFDAYIFRMNNKKNENFFSDLFVFVDLKVFHKLQLFL
jgi:hypothetical protein